MDEHLNERVKSFWIHLQSHAIATAIPSHWAMLIMVARGQASSVCLSVCRREFSHYQPVVYKQQEDGFNVAIFLKQLRSRDMAWKQAKRPTCARVLALHATRRPMSGTNELWTTRRWIRTWRFSWNDCVPEIWRENKRKSQRAVDRAPSPARTRHVNFAGACAMPLWFTGFRQFRSLFSMDKTCWAKVCPQFSIIVQVVSSSHTFPWEHWNTEEPIDWIKQIIMRASETPEQLL